MTSVLIVPSFVNAQDTVENLYFSLKVPDTWTYIEYSNTGYATLMGRGPVNYMLLAPAEFGHLIADESDDTPLYDRITNHAGGGAYIEIYQDTDFAIKNAPLQTYVNYKNYSEGTLAVISQQDTVVGKEEAIRIEGSEVELLKNIKVVKYMVMHDKDAYYLVLASNAKVFDKYLPEFEQMVKSFRFEG